MKKVLATREGLIGGVTACGLTIRSSSIFVALPSRKALWRIVRVIYTPAGMEEPEKHQEKFLAPVLDLGPWFPFRDYGSDDFYVFGDQEPLAAQMKGQIRDGDDKKYVINGAGIDLSDGLIEAFGYRPLSWGIREVEWEFVET